MADNSRQNRGPLTRPSQGTQRIARVPAPVNQMVMNVRQVEVRPPLQHTPGPQRIASIPANQSAPQLSAHYRPQQSLRPVQGAPQGQVDAKHAEYRAQLSGMWNRKHVQKMAPMDVAVADTHNRQRLPAGRQHQMEPGVMAARPEFDSRQPGTSQQHRDCVPFQAARQPPAFDPCQPGPSGQNNGRMQYPEQSNQPLPIVPSGAILVAHTEELIEYNQFFPAAEKPRQPASDAYVDEFLRIIEGETSGSQAAGEDDEDNDAILQQLLASSFENQCSGTKQKEMDEIVKDLKNGAEALALRRRSTEQPPQPPSISPQSDQTGARPAATHPTPPNLPTPPHPQVFAHLPPNFCAPPHPIPQQQHGQHYSCPQHQEDHDITIRRLQDSLYDNDCRHKRIVAEKDAVIKERDDRIRQLEQELAIARQFQPSSSSNGPSTSKRGAVGDEAGIPAKKLCQIKEEVQESAVWVEETPEEAYRRRALMLVKREPQDIHHPVPQVPNFLPFPPQPPMLFVPPPIPNSFFSTSDVTVTNYIQRPAPQRITAFDEAMVVWRQLNAEGFLEQLIRKRPGQGFEHWGPRILNLNTAPFLFNPRATGKQVPQLVKKPLMKGKCFYDFLHGYKPNASNFNDLKGEKEQWKILMAFLVEVMTEQLQAGLIFWPGMKPQ